MVNIVLILAIFGGLQQIDAKTKHLASYITQCHEKDPKLNECWIESGNKAIKDIVEGDASKKIRVLHPLKIDDLLLTPGSLKLHMKNVEITGIENTQIVDGNFDIEKKTIQAKLSIPRVEIIGDYDIDGKILILPINGNGPVNMTMINVIFDYTLEYNVEEKHGHKELVFKSHSIDYKTDRVYYLLENLFNGNKQLGDEMLKFLNENWKEIDKELSGSFIEVLKSIVKEIIVNSVAHVPYEEILLP